MNLKKFNAEIYVPFVSEREAEIVHRVLSVDKEPPRSQITKILTLDKKEFKVYLYASSAHELRIGINSFLDHLSLVVETLDSFGPPVSTEYSYFKKNE